MKISLNWITDYVAIGIPAEKLAHRLTMAGMEVEKIEKIGGDTILELEITPNRPDCLHMIGMAREIAAVLNRSLKPPKVRKIRYPSTPCDVTVLDKEGCSRYIGSLVRNVQITESPMWLQRRLLALGLRPINNVVDITNFCLLETGQPLHAFDYDKLVDGKVLVRRARSGEKISALDGKEYLLDKETLVIADAKHPVAIAGIIGGQETQVTAQTKNILLESAYFQPRDIRRAARALGISTDSSYRFERGVDVCAVEAGANRALALILELAGGRIDQRTDLFFAKRKMSRGAIEVSVHQINALLGASLTSAQCKTILKKLDFEVTVEDRKLLKVRPPSFRGDIHRPVDVVEEVARIIGYDNLPMSLPKVAITSMPKNFWRVYKERMRQALIGQGGYEVITYSMLNHESLIKSSWSHGGGVKILNPLTQEQELLRPTMLPSLLSAVRTNGNRGQRDLRLFEIGKTYSAQGEKETLAVILTGQKFFDWRQDRKDEVDFYDIKGMLQAVENFLRWPSLIYRPIEESYLQTGQAAAIFLQNTRIGVVGKVHPDVLRAWDLKQDKVFFAEMDLSQFFVMEREPVSYAAVPEYPSIIRDISLAVGRDISFQKIADVATKLGGKLLTDVRFVEQYLGDKIPPGSRGIVFSLTYQSSDRTLTEEDVYAVHHQICEALIQDCQAVIR
jgi:phenylalanyl-tRNA synthetase beta chain